MIEVRGGVLEGRPITAEDVENLAKLPPVDAAARPGARRDHGAADAVVGLFTAPLQDLVGLIDARIEQLDASGGAEESGSEPQTVPSSEAEAAGAAPEAEAAAEAEASGSEPRSPEAAETPAAEATEAAATESEAESTRRRKGGVEMASESTPCSRSSAR